MCQSAVLKPAFFAFLFEIDRNHAASVRSRGCACGGPLHQANYERKPNGGPRGAQIDTTRLSFCCGACRRRCTPGSVRFLGRRVYWGVVVVLATALCAGLSLRRGRQLSQQLGVPVPTLERWRTWWLTGFTTSPVWRTLAGAFLPPVAAGALPGALLLRAVAEDERGAMVTVMRWLAPLTTLTEGR